MKDRFLYAFANCKTIDGDDTGNTNAADVDPELVKLEEERGARDAEERGSDSDAGDSDEESGRHDRHRNHDEGEGLEEEHEGEHEEMEWNQGTSVLPYH